MKERYIVGVDVGGSHVCSCVVDWQTGSPVGGRVVKTPVDSTADASTILDAWSANLRDTVTGSGIEGIRSVGFAFPGPFDYEHGVSLIEGVDKFDRIFGLDVATSLLGRLSDLGIEKFRYVNDATAFALGEALAGAARGVERVVALTLGTGVGSGFVADGRPVTSGDTVPANGWVYCLPFEGDIVDASFSTRWCCKRWFELTGERIDGAIEVVKRYDSDERARRLFDEYGRRLADFAGPVLERFGASTLVLGGNISRAYTLFGPAAEARFAETGRRVEIRLSTLLDHAAMMGAASLFG